MCGILHSFATFDFLAKHTLDQWGKFKYRVSEGGFFFAKKNPPSDNRYLNFPHWSRVCFAKKSNVATNIDVANN